MAAACHLATLNSHHAAANQPASPLQNGYSHSAESAHRPALRSTANHARDIEEGSDGETSHEERAVLIRQAEGAARRALGHALVHLNPGQSIPEAAIAHVLQACVELQGSRKGKKGKAEQHLVDAIYLWHEHPKPAAMLMLLGTIRGNWRLVATAVHLQPWLPNAWSNLQHEARSRPSAGVR